MAAMKSVSATGSELPMFTTRQGATGDRLSPGDRRGGARAGQRQVDQQADGLDQIVDVGEVAAHVAVVVDLDRLGLPGWRG